MSAYRLARWELLKCATAALQSLKRALAIPCGLRLALTHLGGSEYINTILTEYQAMRLLSRLEYERSFGARWVSYFVRIPYYVA